MAAAFAGKLPADDFMPADLQDHLIRYKVGPQGALDRFEEFKTKAFEERALQAKGRKRELLRKGET
jgi:hypothetical protein